MHYPQPPLDTLRGTPPRQVPESSTPFSRPEFVPRSPARLIIERACGFLFFTLLHICTTLTVLGQMGDYPYCQILDRQVDPLWEISLGYVALQDVEQAGADDFGLVEWSGRSGLAYLPTVVGTFDLRTALAFSFFLEDGGVDLPDQTGALSLNATWTYRTEAGFALQLGVDPGLYSDWEDLSGQDVFVPFRVRLIQSFHEQLSGLAGLNVYPEFDRLVDPLVGIRCGINDALLLDTAYPESRLLFAPNPVWQFSVGIEARLYPEFSLESGDERDRFMYDEVRWHFQVDRTLWGAVALTARVGEAFAREIDFEDQASSADVNDAFYFQVGVAGKL